VEWGVEWSGVEEKKWWIEEIDREETKKEAFSVHYRLRRLHFSGSVRFASFPVARNLAMAELPVASCKLQA
jgi:hypothetical protein